MKTWPYGRPYFVKGRLQLGSRGLNLNLEICFYISSVKMRVFLGFFIVSEQDGLSGHRDFPWMQLHCNFQGLVAEPNSDRDILAMSVAVRLLSSC